MTMMLPVDTETERLARKLAEVTGKPLPMVIKEAIEAQAKIAGVTVAGTPRRRPDFNRMMEIVQRFEKMPVLDNRSADEIIGYNEFGLPE